MFVEVERGVAGVVGLDQEKGTAASGGALGAAQEVGKVESLGGIGGNDLKVQWRRPQGSLVGAPCHGQE